MFGKGADVYVNVVHCGVLQVPTTQPMPPVQAPQSTLRAWPHLSVNACCSQAVAAAQSSAFVSGTHGAISTGLASIGVSLTEPQPTSATRSKAACRMHSRYHAHATRSAVILAPTSSLL